MNAFLSYLRSQPPLEVPQDEVLRDASDTDLVVIVMGATGSGKSTFINTIFGKEVAPVGHKLDSKTSHVKGYPYDDLEYPQNRIIFVDTPGFDDTTMDDSATLRRIAAWLAASYRLDMKVAGIIYLYEIHQARWGGTPKRNYELLVRLCGEAAAGKVVLFTTKWDKVEDWEGERNEAQLKDVFWSQMIMAGSTVQRGSYSSARHHSGRRAMAPDRGLAQDAMDLLLSHQSTVALQIQDEIVKLKLRLGQTQAGLHLSYLYQQALKDLQSSGEDGGQRAMIISEEIFRLKVSTSRKVLSLLRRMTHK
ncbi:hypothetical protein DXG01_001563 [Tephrocybe rancida]|nr:hypothetical protein DXG01_001563 [Tephrocybe rancida]